MQLIEDLANSVDEGVVEDALKLENGIRDKCDEIKRHKLLIRKMIKPCIKVNASTQHEVKTANKTTEMKFKTRSIGT